MTCRDHHGDSRAWWRRLWRLLRRRRAEGALSGAHAWTPDDPEYIVETGDVGA